MNSRVIISSVVNFISLLKRNPALLSLGSFQSLTNVIDSMGTSSGCKKCPKKAINDNRSYFENAMTNLQPYEKTQMKNILNVQEVCYYTMRNGRLDLACF